MILDKSIPSEQKAVTMNILRESYSSDKNMDKIEEIIKAYN
jgi:hypothetical protein